MRLPLLPRELHTTDRPSSTAQWTTFGRALELQRPEPERIVSDAFAPVFLSATSRNLLASLRTLVGVVRHAERSELLSIATSALCRHRFVDEHLLAALPAADQVVLLGAGYDSRAYRFRAEIGDRPVYEVDLAPLSRHKAAVVAGAPGIFGPTTVRSVEIDFRTQALPDRLADAGFGRRAPAFVAWEGVSMYLDRRAVIASLDALAALCGPGSVLAMDCWQHVGGLRPYDHLRRFGEQAIRLIGEPITFAVTPDGIAELLADAGFEVSDVANARQMTARYATAGRGCDEGMFVVSAVRR
ncbi:MAG TPA: SAM-dependent methyltransferase [Jatrophihabitans sp.]|nr:SAM-dependent methyltransferase [Jatrophihabitans sp.]